MESLSLSSSAHSLSQHAKCTHPEMQAGAGRARALPRGSGVRRAKVTGTIWPAVLCTHHSLPTVKASAVGGTSAQCLLDVRGQPRREKRELGQNLCSWGSEGTLAGGPSPGECVTLYLLHLSGKADENRPWLAVPGNSPGTR